jgi:hypothetical protein
VKIIGIHGAAGSGKDSFADWLVANKSYVKLAFADPMKEFVKLLFPAATKDMLWGPSYLRSLYIDTTPAPRMEEVCAYFVEHTVVAEKQKSAVVKLVDWADTIIERKTVSVREILQTLGTEWGRTVDEHLWVRYMFDKRIPEVHDPAWFGWKSEWGWLPAKNNELGSSCGVYGVVIPDLRFMNEMENIRARGRLARLFKIRRARTPLALQGGIAGHVSESGLPDNAFDAVLDAREGVERLPFLFEAVYERFVRRSP